MDSCFAIGNGVHCLLAMGFWVYFSDLEVVNNSVNVGEYIIRPITVGPTLGSIRINMVTEIIVRIV